jgi:ABC-type amino acid transport substrate-binding protein
MKNRIFILFIISIFSFITFSSFSQTVTLKTAFQNTASKVIKDNSGNYKGICIDLMNLVEKNSNLKFQNPDDFSPLSRIEEGLKNGDTDVYFGLIKNADRETKCTFVEPLYSIKYLLVTTADNKAVIRNIEDFKKAAADTSVLTVLGSTIVNYIQGLGLKADAGGKDVAANFEKLLLGRAKYFIYQDLALLYDMNSEKYKNKFRIISLDLPVEDLWVVTAKTSPDNVKTTLKNTITKLKASGEWDKVVTKYKK